MPGLRGKGKTKHTAHIALAHELNLDTSEGPRNPDGGTSDPALLGALGNLFLTLWLIVCVQEISYDPVDLHKLHGENCFW